jgi:hypothetical protein
VGRVPLVQQAQQQPCNHAAQPSPLSAPSVEPAPGATPTTAAACVAAAALPSAAAHGPQQPAQAWTATHHQEPCYSSCTPPTSSTSADRQQEPEEGEVATSAEVRQGSGGAHCLSGGAVPLLPSPRSEAIKAGGPVAAATTAAAAAAPHPLLPPRPAAAVAAAAAVGGVGERGAAAGRTTPDVPAGRREAPWTRQVSRGSWSPGASQLMPSWLTMVKGGAMAHVMVECACGV